MPYIRERQRQATVPGRIGGGCRVTDESEARARSMVDPVVRTIKLCQRTGDLSTIQPFSWNASVAETRKECGNAFVSTQPAETITLSVHEVGPGALVTLGCHQDPTFQPNDHVG